MPGHGPRRTAAPPPVTGLAPPADVDVPVRRIYNVVDPAALARVYAAALIHGYDDDGAAVSVRAFIALMREPADD